MLMRVTDFSNSVIRSQHSGRMRFLPNPAEGSGHDFTVLPGDLSYSVGLDYSRGTRRALLQSDELHYKESMLHVQKNTQSDLFSSLPTPLQNAENKNKGFKGCLYQGFILVLLFQH